MSKATELIEVEVNLAKLPQEQWDKVKECTTRLADVFAAYDESVARIALAIIGSLIKEDIENGD
jgi:hypothetical protein